MEIRWFGKTCFQIVFPKEKTSIFFDPFDFEEIKADILLFSEIQKKDFKIEKNSFLIEGPGEYEIKGIFIQGIEAQESLTIYTIEGEDLRICHLGSFGKKELSPNLLEKIGPVDILMISIYKEAPRIISQLEPKIVIPMGYSIKKNFDNFLKAMGIESFEEKKRLSLSKKDLKEEGMEIFFLSPQKIK